MSDRPTLSSVAPRCIPAARPRSRLGRGQGDSDREGHLQLVRRAAIRGGASRAWPAFRPDFRRDQHAAPRRAKRQEEEGAGRRSRQPAQGRAVPTLEDVLALRGVGVGVSVCVSASTSVSASVGVSTCLPKLPWGDFG